MSERVFTQNELYINLPEGFLRHDIIPLRPQYDAVLINVPNQLGGDLDEGDYPAFGLARIAASMWEFDKLNCGIFDLQQVGVEGKRITIEDVETQLKMARPKIVGLNPTSVNVDTARVVANLLESMNLPYVIGGYFATLETNKAIEMFPLAYAIVKGKGSIAFSKITKHIISRQSAQLPDIPGVYTSNHSPSKARAEESLKWPNVNPEVYYFKPFEVSKNGKIIKARLYETDGCPHNCGFCASVALNERRYRRPAMDSIIDNVEHVVKMGANRIHFLDDLLLISPEHINSFYEGIKNRQLLGKFDWQGMSRVDLIKKWSDEDLNTLKKSGCFHLAFGVESGSKKILSEIQKGIEPDDVLSITSRLSRYKIGVKGFFIIGFPGETFQQMLETSGLALNMAHAGATHISFHQFQPYPGTPLWEKVVETQPEIVNQIWEYIRHSTNDSGKRRTAIYLPDDIQLSKVKNKAIVNLIEYTTAQFYQIVNNSNKRES
jgi:anaerobic magnesium-protoporphyrin IX monomethyl ester cyclase